ncbi:uroporphyrinogen-III synthase [Solilutibacter silvestris]|uniref:Uroporphyrinogen-III synthase n=1 Tax=Solilutibacter silvestris TaxID=1645665 RepID=A0A2K1Q0V1_9GAMM|nr:uroporphyrinogen-III synthase [Lysobacter silvestris]PNS08672.1 Uroporphyrinogen-III synthase [Lysobacter silvestris]
MRTRREREWYAISLRPQGQHRALRDAVARAGGHLLAMSPLRIVAMADAQTRSRLVDALECPMCVFTSPNAVVCAARLQALATTHAIAVGSGTATSLHRRGVINVAAPKRMDSEGVLDLPMLRDVSGQRIGLVSGAGGRGLIERTLHERGADVLRADVYRRDMADFSPAVLRKFDAMPADAVLFVTSAEALDAALGQLDPSRRSRMISLPVVTASERLRDVCAQKGFRETRVAASARPQDLVRAAHRTPIR